MNPFVDALAPLRLEIDGPTRIRVTGPESFPSAGPGRFQVGTVVAGSLVTATSQPLHSGSSYLLGDGRPPLVGADRAPEPPVVLAAGVGMRESTAGLLRAHLPALTLITGESRQAGAIGMTMDLLVQESGTDVACARMMREHLSQLLFLQIVRVALGQRRSAAAPGPGALTAVTDERIAVAVGLMHQRPAERWTVAGLAAASNMSRSAFASRFRLLVGAPPLEYLEQWRIRNAATMLLATDRTVGAIASQFGYSADSTFSRAFKRVMGQAPKEFRQVAT